MTKEILIEEISAKVVDLLGRTGLNTASDFDGIESDEDILLYLDAIIDEIPYKELGVKYYPGPGITVEEALPSLMDKVNMLSTQVGLKGSIHYRADRDYLAILHNIEHVLLQLPMKKFEEKYLPSGSVIASMPPEMLNEFLTSTLMEQGKVTIILKTKEGDDS